MVVGSSDSITFPSLSHWIVVFWVCRFIAVQVMVAFKGDPAKSFRSGALMIMLGGESGRTTAEGRKVAEGKLIYCR